MRPEIRPGAVARSPMVQFMALGLLLFLVLAVVSDRLTDRAAEDESLGDARATTWILAHSVVEPSLTEELVAGDPGAIDRFDREVLGRLLVGDVRRIKMWAPDGTIVYSDQTELIGERFELGGAERRILREGGTDAEVSALDEPENRLEAGETGLVEVYTRVQAPDGTALLFEAYYSADDIAANAQRVFTPFRRIMVGSLVLLGGLAAAIIWGLTRRLRRAASERQRLLQAAIDASEAERRRIARDLHDGVVQDLAGTAFALSAAGREGGPVAPAGVTEAAESLRGSLKALRSLLVEIHPPDLAADGLAAALDDLVAPAARAGMEAHVHLDGVTGAPDHVVALLWRVAQEAVRNALRHSGGSRLDVEVRREGGRLVLLVRDDGVGIDDSRPRRAESLGLRGLRSLVQEEGGRLTVQSQPGRGTTVRAEVAG
ncbi:MAG TPA: ATP-binding protein [Nocardioides sp.]|nr:ATP-binding protein [Nocardioides sp.]